MSFEQLNLDPQISKAINICGYKTPTPIQARCIPDILNGKDIVASAQTGTGKTAAFVLPALQRISLKKAANKPRILILTPTRELAAQITKSASMYGKFLRFNMASLVGGMSYRQQIRDLSRAADIIVATPGRLLDHVENGRVDLSGIEMLILDEADRMLDMGFIEDVQAIASETPSQRQTLLFSATVDNKLAHVVRHLLNNPVRVDLSQEVISPSQIKQTIYMADNIQHKSKLLYHFLQNENIFKGIIFSGTKINADRLAKEMRDMGFEALALHGDLKQSVRTKTVEQLKRGKIQFIVATDVAARGIHISDVTHVINFDLPRFSEDYVHRIGRTGRAGKTGVAISLVIPADSKHLQRIERFTGTKIQREVIEGLEPSKKSFSDDSGKKKKKFGKKGGGKSFSGGRSDTGRRFKDKPFKDKSSKDKSEQGGFSERRKDSGKRFADKPEKSGFSERRKDSGKRFADKSEKGGFSERRKDSGKRFADKSEKGGFSERRKDSGKRFADKAEKGGFSERRKDVRFKDKPERKEFSDRKKRDGFGGRDSAPKKSFGGKPGKSFSGGRSFEKGKRKD